MTYITEENRIYSADESGKTVAEITFPETEAGVFTIDHTFVDTTLRGMGIASELVALAVAEIGKKGGTVKASCTYAKGWLEKNQL